MSKDGCSVPRAAIIQSFKSRNMPIMADNGFSSVRPVYGSQASTMEMQPLQMRSGPAFEITGKAGVG
jgi:hypothetical protein